VVRLADGGGGGGDYSAIDVEQLESMIGSLSSAAELLQGKASSLGSAAAFWGIGSSEFREIGEIGRWAEDEGPGLRRRLNLAKAIDARSASIGTVYLTEPVLSEAEAERRGEELAQRLLEHNRTDEEGAELMHDVASELGAYSDDPDVLSAFYAELGPQYTQMIPSLMPASGSDTAAEDLEVYSRALGVATLDTDPSSGFTEVKDSFTAVPEDDEDLPTGTAWSRLAMVQYGDYPPDWLRDVVRVNALDSFAEDPDRDFRGATTAEMQAYGLPEDTVGMAFHALRDQSDVAREVLTTMGEPDHGMTIEELTDTVYGYAGSRGTGDDVADAYGLAIESGVGVHDEEAGQHSQAAGSLAEDFIIASSDHEDPPWMLKDSLSKVATSYSHELVTSANTQPGNTGDVPGLTPVFTVDSEQTYGFLRGFADDDQFTDPFDEAMGQLYHDVLSEAARADQADIAAGRQDPERFEYASGLFGDLAGLEYEAKNQVRGDMDERDEQMRSMFKDIVTFPLGFVPGDQYIEQGLRLSADGAKVVWNVAQYGMGKGLDAGLETAPEDTRVGQIESEEHAMVLSHQYVVAQSLLDAGYPATPLPEEVGSDGRLRDFDDIDPHAFQEWLRANDGTASFTSKVDQGDRIFLGGNSRGQHVAQSYEEEHD
jgi:hypothetical protein